MNMRDWDEEYGHCFECHGYGIAYLEGTNTGRGKVGVLCPICDGSGMRDEVPAS